MEITLVTETYCFTRAGTQGGPDWFFTTVQAPGLDLSEEGGREGGRE